MDKRLIAVIALQVGIIAMVRYNDSQIEKALPEAAAQGHDAFNARITNSYFSSTGGSLTMVNGWRSRTNPSQCSVNIVHSDDGTPIADTFGFIFDLHPPARRYPISDCRKLQDRVFQPYVSG